jgi:hypothetical protein
MGRHTPAHPSCVARSDDNSLCCANTGAGWLTCGLPSLTVCFRLLYLIFIRVELAAVLGLQAAGL